MTISEEGKTLTMRAPDNWHAHFRQGQLLQYLVKVFIDSGWRHRVVAEPNTLPPKLTGVLAMEYALEISHYAKGIEGGKKFQPIATIQLTEETTREMIYDAFLLGVRVIKVYPRYVTTHSANGVVDYTKIYPALSYAEQLDMVVQFHPEHPSYDVMGRRKESEFRKILIDIVRKFPLLKVSVEHVSSADMVQWVKDQSDAVGASITIHHLYVTSDDLNGYSERSGGLICVHDGGFKPGAKDPEDRTAVQNAAFSGDKKFWYGGDDAAHLKSKKECARASCGAWNTIPALPMLISLFEKHGFLSNLERFISENGARFYSLPLNKEKVSFVRESWKVPMECEVPGLNDSIVPFFAGEEMEWKLLT